MQIGALGFPMVFNNVITNRTLDQAHTTCSFADPYVGRDAGYLLAIGDREPPEGHRNGLTAMRQHVDKRLGLAVY